MIRGAVLATVWAALHLADWVLTIHGARLRASLGSRIRSNGSYELNPLFQKAVDRGTYFSPRFLVSLVVPLPLFVLLGAVLDSAESHHAYSAPFTGGVMDFMLGLVVYVHIAILSLHLQNIWLFRRMLRDPAAVTGTGSSFSREVTYRLSAQRYLATLAILLFALWRAPAPDLAGGALGLSLVALKHTLLAWRVSRQPAAPSAG